MKKHIALFAAAIFAVTCFGSCGRKDTETIPEKEILCDWQKEILAAEGLPTEADQLTSSQLRSIQRIYEMITYLNEKYNEEFIYAGYLEPASNQTETLYAYPRLLGADYGRNTVTVKASGKEFTDDYHDKSVVDYYNELVTDFIHDYFDSDDFVVFTDVNSCKITKSEVVDLDFQWELGVHDSILISDKICNKDNVEQFAVNLAKYLYEHRIAGRRGINIIPDMDEKKITYANFSDYFEGDGFGFYDFSFDSSRKNIHQCEFLGGKRAQNDYSIEEFFAKYN